MSLLNAATPPTWDDLVDRVQTGTGSAARHQVGAWAIRRVEHALGDDWPQRWYARFGDLPAFVGRPGSDAAAYAQLVETALRLDTVADVLRFRRLTKDWSHHLEPIRLGHVDLQLEVAALARSAGHAAEFEKPIELSNSQRPADVVLGTESGSFIVECFCVYTDRATGTALSYDRNLGFRLRMMAIDHDVSISGRWDVRLPEPETAQLLAQAAAAMDEARAGQHPAVVRWPGIELRVEPGPLSSDQAVRLIGPQTTSPGWSRAGQIIEGKAQDWADAPLPVWLRVDLLDGTWLFSQWAQRDLPSKTQWMADLLAQTLSGTRIAGVVISGGPRIDPNAPAEDHADHRGVTGMRRHLDALRTRDTLIVPLTKEGQRHTAVWRSLYDTEPAWLQLALRAASLPGIDAIEEGWSAPNGTPPAGTT